MTNVTSVIGTIAEQAPSTSAVTTEEQRHTAADLWDAAGRFGAGLRERGVTGGTAVAIQLPPGVPRLIAVLGTLRNGSVVVPIPDRGRRTIVDRCRACDVRTIVTTSETSDVLLASSEDLSIEFRVVLGGQSLGITFESFLDNDGLGAALGAGGASSRGFGGFGFGTQATKSVVSRAETDPALLTTRDDSDETVVVGTSHGALRRAIETTTAAIPHELGVEDRVLEVAATSAGRDSAAHYPLSLPALAAVSSGAEYVLASDREDGKKRPPSEPPSVAFLATGRILDALEPLEREFGPSSVKAVSILGRTPDGDTCDAVSRLSEEPPVQLAGGVTHVPLPFGAVRGDGLVPDSVGKPLDGVDVRIVDADDDVSEFSTATDDARADDAVGRLYVASDEHPLVGGGALDSTQTTSDADRTQWIRAGVDAARSSDGYLFFR